DEEQVELLRQIPTQKEGDIKQLGKDYIELQNNERISADVIICCTGSNPLKIMPQLTINNKYFDLLKVKKMYRYCVIPEIPNLVFTFYAPFSIGMCGCYSRA